MVLLNTMGASLFFVFVCSTDYFLPYNFKAQLIEVVTVKNYLLSRQICCQFYKLLLATKGRIVI